MSYQQSIDYVAIGIRLNQRRRALRMTQGELGERVGVSTSFIGHIERAEKIPSLETVVRLCVALDITLDEFILGQKPRCIGETCALYDQLSALLKSYGLSTQGKPPAT